MLCRIFFSLLISLRDFFFLKKGSCVYIYKMYLHLHCGHCSNSSNMELQSLKMLQAIQNHYCCAATAGSEQQHNQDLKKIYKGRRILEFISFYHNALQFKVTRPCFFGRVPSYFEALWYTAESVFLKCSLVPK